MKLVEGVKLKTIQYYIMTMLTTNNCHRKSIRSLYILELYIYLKKISKITQVLSDSFVGCPSSGVNKYRLTKKQRNAVLNSQQKWKFWARILKERPNKVFFYNPVVNDIVHRLDVVCQRLSNYPPDLAMFSILLSFSYSPLLRQVRHTCQSRKFF